jgi:hypothetical protein
MRSASVVSVFVIGSLVGLGACARTGTRGPETAVDAATPDESTSAGSDEPTKPSPPLDEVEAHPPDEQAQPERAEAVYLEWSSEPFTADLDGDGTAEPVSWTCKDAFSVRVGKRTFKARDDISELMGCLAATFDPDPTMPGELLVFCLDEHEEVGADSCWFLAADSSALDDVLFVDEELTFLSDHTWMTGDEDCYDVDRVYRTSEDHYRWRNGKLEHEQAQFETPLEEESCPSEP